MRKRCLFLPKKDKKLFAYDLEFMLTLDKMLNIMALMCKSLESVCRAFRKLFKYLILYAQFSISDVLTQWSSLTQSSGLYKRTVRICRGLSILYLSQHRSFGVLVAFSTDEGQAKPVQTRISLCY